MLAYKERGKGPAFILLHGFPLNSGIWEQQLEALSERYRVIAPDLPGHGASPLLPEISIAGMAAEVFRLMDGLHIRRAAVAGHSMGGYVALAMAKQAAERISGLALICTQPGNDSPEARERRYALAEKVEQQGTEALVEAMLPKLFAPGESNGESRTAGMIRKAPAQGAQAALKAMAVREEMYQLLPLITVPTLVLTGQEDQLIPPDRSATMAAQIKNAVLVKVAGAGHMPMLERPEMVTDALRDWMELVN